MLDAKTDRAAWRVLHRAAVVEDLRAGVHTAADSTSREDTATYNNEWLGSRVVSVLNSGAEVSGPGFKLQPRRCRVTVLRKLFTPIVPLFTKQLKLVPDLLRVAEVTAGMAESNGSLSPGSWLTSPACWLQRCGISSGTLRSVIEYGLIFFTFLQQLHQLAG